MISKKEIVDRMLREKISQENYNKIKEKQNVKEINIKDMDDSSISVIIADEINKIIGSGCNIVSSDIDKDNGIIKITYEK